MSDEIAPITLTTLYEMMVDLTRMIELILSEYPSSSRRAPKVVMPLLLITTKKCYFVDLIIMVLSTFE